MRKLMLSALSLILTAGLVLAVSVTLVSYDETKKELKVKDGDAEKTYKVTDKTVFKSGDKDVTLEDATKSLNRKGAAGKAKLEITVDGDKLTEVKLPMRKMKAMN